ncbi:hypothetical protein [Halorientalis halophila]|uniref:hypothetical protein n=1 Tax=Halorientalis halophila TaxID=3108499 RepID=UPI00300821A2
MAIGEDERDALAYELARSKFEAAERGGYRAEWTAGDTAIEVREMGGGDGVVYDAEDLLRAESDREVKNARTPQG